MRSVAVPGHSNKVMKDGLRVVIPLFVIRSLLRPGRAHSGRFEI